jgi:hypothetical protein
VIPPDSHHDTRPEALQHHGMDDDDLPELGDLKCLTRLVRQASEAIERMDLPDHEPQAWIAEIEAAFEAAAGRLRLSCNVDRFPANHRQGDTLRIRGK